MRDGSRIKRDLQSPTEFWVHVVIYRYLFLGVVVPFFRVKIGVMAYQHLSFARYFSLAAVWVTVFGYVVGFVEKRASGKKSDGIAPLANALFRQMNVKYALFRQMNVEFYFRPVVLVGAGLTFVVGQFRQPQPLVKAFVVYSVVLVRYVIGSPVPP